MKWLQFLREKVIGDLNFTPITPVIERRLIRYTPLVALSDRWLHRKQERSMSTQQVTGAGGGTGYPGGAGGGTGYPGGAGGGNGEVVTYVVNDDEGYYIGDIAAFHQKFDILDGPEVYLERHAGFRQVALLEELSELSVAFGNGDLASYLDALVDFAYFNAGTILLLGQQSRLSSLNDPTWQALCHMKKDFYRGHTLSAPRPPMPGQYTFLLGSVYTSLGSAFHSVMMASRNPNDPQHFANAANALVEAHRTVVDHAFLCGLDFVTAWQRVHDANMRKQRASKPSDSKRGSRYDVVKPDGWVAPDLRDLVAEEITETPLVFQKAAA